MLPGKSIFVMGPSGTGKSTLARNAVIELGTGIVVLAPGIDEHTSYLEWQQEKMGVSSPVILLPTQRASRLLPQLEKIYNFNVEQVKEHGKAFHRILVFDTHSGLDQGIRHQKLKSMGLDVPPKARSSEGADFYQYLQYAHERTAEMGRQFREIGVHWLGLCHTKVRFVDETTMQATGLEEDEAVQPMLTGVSRDSIPAAFDLVVHSRIINKDGVPTFVLQWKADHRKITKSRYGDLAKNEIIPNNWKAVLALIAKAEQRRMDEFKARQSQAGGADGTS